MTRARLEGPGPIASSRKPTGQFHIQNVSLHYQHRLQEHALTLLQPPCSGSSLCLKQSIVQTKTSASSKRHVGDRPKTEPRLPSFPAQSIVTRWKPIGHTQSFFFFFFFTFETHTLKYKLHLNKPDVNVSPDTGNWYCSPLQENWHIFYVGNLPPPFQPHANEDASSNAHLSNGHFRLFLCLFKRSMSFTILLSSCQNSTSNTFWFFQQ